MGLRTVTAVRASPSAALKEGMMTTGDAEFPDSLNDALTVQHSALRAGCDYARCAWGAEPAGRDGGTRPPCRVAPGGP
jgi:hypothetical protein